MFKKALFIFSLYLPLQLAINPTSSVDLASIRVLIVLIFLSWLSLKLFRGKLVIPTNPSALFLYSFLFFSVFSVFFAENINWSLRKLLFLFSILPVYFIFYDAYRQNWHIKIIEGLIYGAFAVSLLGLFQFSAQFLLGIEKVYAFWGKFVAPLFLGNAFSASVLEYPSWLVNISGKTIFRAISVFPDPHMFSFYLGMIAPLALALYFYTKKQHSFFLIAFFVIITTALLTFSRGSYLGLIVSAIVVIVFLLRNTSLSPHAFIRLIIGSILIICLLYLITPLRTRFLASFDFEEGSNRGRIELWTKAVQTIQENPLGVGIGNLPLNFVPSASYRDPIYAHSLYLDIAAESGLPALLNFLLMLFFVFRSLLLSAKNNYLYLGLLASLVFFASYSLVETPLYSVHVLTLFFILLAFSHTHETIQNN